MQEFIPEISFTIVPFWTKTEFLNVAKIRWMSWGTVSSETGSWQSYGGGQEKKLLKGFSTFSCGGQIEEIEETGEADFFLMYVQW